MSYILKGIRVLFITVLCLTIPTYVLAISENVNTMNNKKEVNINKDWIVKFNLELDKNTVNNNNILVRDIQGNKENVVVSLGKDLKSIVINFPTGGYIPGNTYCLELSTKVKSKSGKNIVKPVKMNFKTSNQYKDCTSFESLPKIQNVKLLKKPILINEKFGLNIFSKYNGKVQYRIYCFKYPDEVYDNSNNKRYSKVNYMELTKGYTKGCNGSEPYLFQYDKGLDDAKYKVIVYVRKYGNIGSKEDVNTDYDNYFTMYFKVLNKNITKKIGEKENIIYKNYHIDMDEAVNKQTKLCSPVYSESTGWMKASKGLVNYYIDPSNFVDDYGKYQFLKLNYMEVSSIDLDNLLNEKGILKNKGEVFLKAAKENNINPIYLVSHALLETGNGKSKLSTGVLVSSVDGKKVTPKKTYNIFGIHAYDSDPVKCGAEYAYKQNWFSIDSAIIGGAKFIGGSYINRNGEKQDTLYKMRWDLEFKKSPHQYATDIGWSRKQILRIKSMVEQCTTAKPIFEIPKLDK